MRSTLSRDLDQGPRQFLSVWGGGGGREVMGGPQPCFGGQCQPGLLTRDRAPLWFLGPLGWTSTGWAVTEERALGAERPQESANVALFRKTVLADGLTSRVST